MKNYLKACFYSDRRRTWNVLRVLVVVLFFALCSGLSGAQSITGDIVGIVADPAGAAVPGATVTLTNVGTQEKRTLTSSPSGEYTFSSLQPGQYTLQAGAAGFKLLTISPFPLGAGSRTRVDATLQIGATSEVVEVMGNSIPSLQTDSGSVQDTVTERAVQDLPLNGRNFVGLVQVTAGVNQGLAGSIASGTRPDDRRQSSSFSANGQPDTLNNNLIDGLDNNEREQGFIGVRPSIDAISEIRIQTNTYSAEEGQDFGGKIPGRRTCGFRHGISAVMHEHPFRGGVSPSTRCEAAWFFFGSAQFPMKASDAQAAPKGGLRKAENGDTMLRTSGALVQVAVLPHPCRSALSLPSCPPGAKYR